MKVSTCNWKYFPLFIKTLYLANRLFHIIRTESSLSRPIPRIVERCNREPWQLLFSHVAGYPLPSIRREIESIRKPCLFSLSHGLSVHVHISVYVDELEKCLRCKSRSLPYPGLKLFCRRPVSLGGGDY